MSIENCPHHGMRRYDTDLYETCPLCEPGQRPRAGKRRVAMGTTRRQYGDREACTRCGQDIEWTGRARGWRDRGGNRQCCAYIVRGEVITPKGLHTVRVKKGTPA